MKPRRAEVQIQCDRCGASFARYRSTVAKAKRHYCSRACQIADRTSDHNPNWRGGPAACTCEKCGNAFDRVRAEAATEGKARFCSFTCKVEAQRVYAHPSITARVHRRRREVRDRATRETVTHHSEAEWEALLAAHGGKCAACGSVERIERDHIVPLSAGGDDTIENIQPLCMTCNRVKWTKAWAA